MTYEVDYKACPRVVALAKTHGITAIQELIDSAPNVEKRIVDGKRQFIVIPPKIKE